ncbi:transposase [Shewanella indica]|uniref:transposase n=1 Tax=Shewanella indica TaxID=768528 RepID=UPI00399A1304
MKKRYTEEQIIKAIKQHEAGAKVDDICREMGISTGTFYNWRSKYAGLEVNEAKRLLDEAEILSPKDWRELIGRGSYDGLTDVIYFGYSFRLFTGGLIVIRKD